MSAALGWVLDHAAALLGAYLGLGLAAAIALGALLRRRDAQAPAEPESWPCWCCGAAQPSGPALADHLMAAHPLEAMPVVGP